MAKVTIFPPYILFLLQVGDKVQKGQVICIIEAMKLMNEIEVCYYFSLKKLWCIQLHEYERFALGLLRSFFINDFMVS